MPLSKLFAERVHFFEELPFIEAYPLFDAPISEYVSPALEVNDHIVSTGSGEVPVLVYQPLNTSAKLPGIIWMHGGGFQQGTYTMNESNVVSRELAHRGNFVLINVEYRLVNETTKFPAPQNDCMAVLEWVVQNHEALNVDVDAIFVGGVSAGGCLAASMAVLDRDNGNNYIAGQLLNCPVLHKEIPPLSDELAQKMSEVPAQLGFTNEFVSELNRFVLESGDIKDLNPAWLPGETKNLNGLAPAQILNCEYDTLRASGEQYGRQLESTGVHVEVLTQRGVPHAHLNRLPEDCPEVIDTLNEIIRFVKQISAK